MDLNGIKRRNVKYRQIVEERFGLIDGKPKTLVDLSKKYNVTGERIRQQESQAMRLLRKNPEMRKLRDFLR